MANACVEETIVVPRTAISSPKLAAVTPGSQKVPSPKISTGRISPRSPDEGETKGEGNGLVEIPCLRGNVSLVVVQGEDGVKVSLEAEVVDRIGTYGAGYVETLSLSFLDCR